MARPLRDLAQVGLELRSNLERLEERATRAAAGAVKDRALANVERVIGGDRRMRNVGKSGARVGVGYDLDNLGAQGWRATIRARGPWQLVERKIRPHVITSRRAGGSRKSRAERVESGRPLLRPGVVVIPGVGPRRFVRRHPGVRSPRQPWAKTMTEADTITRHAFASGLTDAVTKAVR